MKANKTLGSTMREEWWLATPPIADSLFRWPFHSTAFAVGLLAALFATKARAVEIVVDPGPIGAQPVNIPFVLDSLDGTVDLIFTEPKNLEFGPGTLEFGMQAGGLVAYDGFLFDESGEIPGTTFTGIAGAISTTLELAGETVWSGMRFLGNFQAGSYTLIWSDDGDGLPTVIDSGFVCSSTINFNLNTTSATDCAGEVMSIAFNGGFIDISARNLWGQANVISGLRFTFNEDVSDIGGPNSVFRRDPSGANQFWNKVEDVPGNSLTFEASDPSEHVSFDDDYFWKVQATFVDSFFEFGSFTLEYVPEPSAGSLAVTALACIGMLARSRRCGSGGANAREPSGQRVP